MHFAARTRDARELGACFNSSLIIRASTYFRSRAALIRGSTFSPDRTSTIRAFSFHARLRQGGDNAPDFRNYLLHAKLPTKSRLKLCCKRFDLCELRCPQHVEHETLRGWVARTLGDCLDHNTFKSGELAKFGSHVIPVSQRTPPRPCEIA